MAICTVSIVTHECFPILVSTAQVGSPLLAGSYPGLGPGAVQGTPPEGGAPGAPGVAVPDSGISAWRSLFVCNELKLGATMATMAGIGACYQ